MDERSRLLEEEQHLITPYMDWQDLLQHLVPGDKIEFEYAMRNASLEYNSSSRALWNSSYALHQLCHNHDHVFERLSPLQHWVLYEGTIDGIHHVIHFSKVGEEIKIISEPLETVIRANITGNCKIRKNNETDLECSPASATVILDFARNMCNRQFNRIALRIIGARCFCEEHVNLWRYNGWKVGAARKMVKHAAIAIALLIIAFVLSGVGIFIYFSPSTENTVAMVVAVLSIFIEFVAIIFLSSSLFKRPIYSQIASADASLEGEQPSLKSLYMEWGDQELISALEPGDKIEFSRWNCSSLINGFYQHWAIYIGKIDNEPHVIHYTEEDKEFKVAKDTLEKAAKGGKFRINNQSDTEFLVHSRATILENAEALLHTQNYHLFKYNCEHFANYCRYGSQFSDQAQDATLRGIIIAVVLLLGVVHFVSLFLPDSMFILANHRFRIALNIIGVVTSILETYVLIKDLQIAVIVMCRGRLKYRP